jgi:hypothetical protein
MKIERLKKKLKDRTISGRTIKEKTKRQLIADRTIKKI